MKKLLLTLLLLLSLGFAASAGKVDFDFKPSSTSGLPTANVTSATEKTFNGYTLTFYNTWWNKSKELGFIAFKKSVTDAYVSFAGFASNQIVKQVTLTVSANGYASSSFKIFVDDVQAGTITYSNSKGSLSIPANLQKPGAVIKIATNKSSNQCSFSTVSFDVEEDSSTPVISAATGETTYTAGDEPINVVKGTVVTFNVTNCEDADITAKGLIFNNGNATATINSDVTYTITAGETTAKYVFQVLKPVITAKTGDTTYTPGETPNEVAKGTVVTFNVANCADEDITAAPELTFTNGTATATITADASYTIMADDEIEEFNFTIIKPTIKAEKIIIAANGEPVTGESIELYAGTELTFSYAETLEGLSLSYTTDATTYTDATSYIFNPGEGNEVDLFVKAACEDSYDEVLLTITKKAVEAPSFNVENGTVYANDEIKVVEVPGVDVNLTVSKNGGEATSVTGNSYIVNDDVDTELTFTATASVTLNEITTISEPTTLTVTVAEKTEVMFDFTTNPAYGMTQGENYLTADKVITEHPIVTLNLSGTYRLYTSGDLRLHATQPKSDAAAGRLAISVPKEYYITGVVFGTGSKNTNAGIVTEGTTIDNNKWDMGGLKLSKVFIQRGTGNPIIKTVTVSYAKRDIWVHFANVDITHGKVAGVVTIEYGFDIANHNGGNVDVTATINGKVYEFENVALPASAPARVDAENPLTNVSGKIKATHADFKGATNLQVNVKATLDGNNELYNEVHAVTNTTGIEDVTVEGGEAAEYFNLQGIRVAEPQAGQVYIVRRGAKTTKELVK